MRRRATVDRSGYKRYIRSSEWAEKKRQFRASKLCKNRCAVCRRTDRVLDVHHKSYKRLGNENLTDLIELCRECHDLTHEAHKRAKNKSLWTAHKRARR